MEQFYDFDELPNEITVTADELGVEKIDSEVLNTSAIDAYVYNYYGFSLQSYDYDPSDDEKSVYLSNIEWDNATNVTFL